MVSISFQVKNMMKWLSSQNDNCFGKEMLKAKLDSACMGRGLMLRCFTRKSETDPVMTSNLIILMPLYNTIISEAKSKNSKVILFKFGTIRYKLKMSFQTACKLGYPNGKSSLCGNNHWIITKWPKP